MTDPLPTQPSLLLQLRKEDAPEEWETFYHRYSRFILSVCIRYGLTPAEAEDVLQETMVELICALRKFEYDPSRGRFRGFLKTIVVRKVSRRHKKRPPTQPIESTTPEGAHLLRILEDPDSPSPLHGLDDVWRQTVLEEALIRLRDSGVNETHLEAFDFMLQGLPIEEIADRTGMKPNALYQVKHRMVKQIRDAVAQVIEDTQL